MIVHAFYSVKQCNKFLVKAKLLNCRKAKATRRSKFTKYIAFIELVFDKEFESNLTVSKSMELKYLKAMKLLLMINLIFLSLGVFQCKPKISWSENQGRMKWKDAKGHCNRIGMRLPTEEELSIAYKEKLVVEWEKNAKSDYSHYWTIEEESDGTFDFIGMGIMSSNNGEKIVSRGNVRCVK